MNKDFEKLEGNQRVWIFQANPKLYRIIDALAVDEIKEKMHWAVRQHRSRIKKGDIGIIWQCGSNAGILAITKILSNPRFMTETEIEDKFWIKDEDKGKVEWMVEMKVIRDISKCLLSRPELRKETGLQQMSLLRPPYNRTNFPVTTAEWNIIREIINIKNQ